MADVIHNDLTAHLGLPLPHPSNDLEDDVPRLRDALQAIDGKFHALDLLLQSDDVNLDQLQELVNAIKTNAGDVLNLLASKADSAALAAVILDKASRAELAALDAAKASKAELTAAVFPPPGTPLSGPAVLEAGKRYDLNSTAGPFTVTLPAAGAWVWLRDAAGKCGINPVTVLRGAGQTIYWQADDLLMDKANDSVLLLLNASNWSE